ncbi:MAG TPA: pyridoxamine 5'-phosphate oxidase family protein [Solirubrobacter sp.]|nr:pyridoxamine 5'-phosphate oxidase family protein [Solirubrobacter sp.]
MDTGSARVARGLIDANPYLTLATADRDGRPWASPVWFAHDRYASFYWVSAPDSRHSRNIAERAQVAIVIFDSTVPVGSGQAVYADAEAAQVGEDELARAIEVLSRRSEAHGARAWTAADVTGPAALRLYRAVATEHSLVESAQHPRTALRLGGDASS